MCSNWFFSSSSIRWCGSPSLVFFIIIIGSISMEINSKTWLGTSAKYYAINTRMPTQFSLPFFSWYYLLLSLLLLLLLMLSLVCILFLSSFVICSEIPNFFPFISFETMDMSCLQIESNSGRVRERKLHNNEKQTSYQMEPRRKKKIKLLIYHK